MDFARHKDKKISSGTNSHFQRSRIDLWYSKGIWHWKRAFWFALTSISFPILRQKSSHRWTFTADSCLCRPQVVLAVFAKARRCTERLIGHRWNWFSWVPLQKSFSLPLDSFLIPALLLQKVLKTLEISCTGNGLRLKRSLVVYQQKRCRK